MSFPETSLNIEALLPWSEPKTIPTARGPKILRKAKPTEGFWVRWRAEKEALRSAGLSCGRDKLTSQWEVLWWQDANPETAAKQRAREASALIDSRATDAEFDVPRPDGLEFRAFQRAGIKYVLDAWGETPCQ